MSPTADRIARPPVPPPVLPEQASGHTRAGSTAGERLPAKPFHDRTGLLELVVLALLFVAYNVVRALPSATAEVAVKHAHLVLSWEGPIFANLEVPLNRWLEGTPVLAVAACYFYAVLHYVATPTVLLISRRRGGWVYRRGYWMLVLASALALVGYTLFPTAPPRLVPDLGIVDVLRSYSGYGWWGSAASAPRGLGDATNQFAALPSMHFGWALWCSIQMWGFGWRLLAVAYPCVLVVVVLGTGNHFVLDVLAGGACVLVAYGVVSLARRVAGPGPGPSRAAVARYWVTFVRHDRTQFTRSSPVVEVGEGAVHGMGTAST